MNTLITMAVVMNLSVCGGVKTGRLLGLASDINDALVEVDIDTGEVTFLHYYDVKVTEGGLAVGPDGTLYAAFSGSVDQLVILDPDTGDLTFVGPFGFADVSALTFGPDGTLYGFDSTSDQLITVDPLTGEGRGVGFAASVGNAGLAFTPDGTLYLVGSPVGGARYCSATTEKGFGSLYSVDPTTGDATWVGDFSKDRFYVMSGLAFLPGTGDADRDGDVDHDDFLIFESCFTGPLDTKDPLPVECQFLDTDQDNDIDCDDWLDFVDAWTEEEDPPIFPPCEPCAGDANSDGTVDPLDSGFVLARFGCEVGEGDPNCDIADQNGDGSVDPLDVGFVLARFGPCD